MLTFLKVGLMSVQGYHGIEDEIYISLPVVVGESGITSVFNQKINDEERAKIQKSAKTLREVLDGVKMWSFRLSSHCIVACMESVRSLIVCYLFPVFRTCTCMISRHSPERHFLRVIVIRTQGTIRVVILLFIHDVMPSKALANI